MSLGLPIERIDVGLENEGIFSASDMIMKKRKLAFFNVLPKIVSQNIINLNTDTS